MIKIRIANDKDIKQIYSIAKQVYKMVSQHRSKFFGKLREFCGKPNDYLKLISSRDSVLFVAEEKTVVGYVYATIEKQPDDLIGIPYVSINEIAVKQTYQHRGIGKLLMRGINKWAKENKIKVIQLATWEFNTDAIKFFKKLGYKTIMRKMEKVLK